MKGSRYIKWLFGVRVNNFIRTTSFNIKQFNTLKNWLAPNNEIKIMAPQAQGLIPARFLTLLSHFTVLVLIFFSRKQNIDACMTLDGTEREFQLKENQLVIGLAISIAFVLIELIGFLSGVSMFKPLPSLISIAGHFCGSVSLSYFIFDRWDCNIFWWIFAFCSAIPAFVEIIVFIKVIILQKF